MRQTITLTGFLIIWLCSTAVRSIAQKCDAVYADDNVVLASVEKKLYRSVDGGSSFSMIMPAGEDNLEIRCITKVNSTLIIGGINGSRIFRSTDNGATWTVANAGMPTISGVVISVPSRALSVGGRAFMGGTNFSRYSDDEGLSWKNLAGVADHTSAIKYSGRLWHSSIYGNVSYSSDNGSTWTETATKPYYLGLSGRGFVQFGDTLVALSDKNAGAAVDRTYDNGATWKPAGNLSLGLDMVEVSGKLYATSNDGLMLSEDHGINWVNVCTSFKYYAYGGKMSVHNDDIWIASGNGILRYNMSTGTCNLNVPTSIGTAATAAAVEVYPNPATASVRIKNLAAGTQICITDITGKVCYTTVADAREIQVNTAGYHNGVYLLTLTSGAERMVKKLLISK
jgi:hypothetical protein